jgi:excisionase family DNA binding protein
MSCAGFALPVRPRPIGGELSVGYLSRVAEANGYEGVRALCRAISSKGRSITDGLQLEPQELGRLFGPLPMPCSADQATTYGISIEQFNHQYLRWCPACLKSKGCFNGAWGLKLCCVCLEHQALLVECCPSCQERQSLGRCSLRCSACGHDLYRADAAAVDAASLDLHARLYTGIEVCLQTKRASDVMEWLKLVKYLGPFGADPWCRRPGQTIGLHRLPEAMMLVRATACVLDGWPKNFQALLHRARSRQPAASHLAQAYGPLYRVLYRNLAAPAFDALRDVFEQHLHENWFGMLGQRNRWLRPDTVSKHPRQRTKVLAKNAGVGRADVQHLACSGSIPVYSVQHGSGRVTRAFASDATQQIQQLKQDRMTLREASSILCIGRWRVRELIDAGLLRAWVDRRRANAATWWLSKSDIMRLTALNDNVEAGRDGRPGCVALTTVMKAWRLQPGEFPALVQAMVTKKLAVQRPAGHSQGLGRVDLQAKELRAWLLDLRTTHGAWVSVDEAARRLGLKQQVTYELVARGFIASVVLGRCRRVTPQAIECFRATYVSLSEIATAQAVAPRRMLALLACQPICGPGVDGARQYFYRRDDLGLVLGPLLQKGIRP